MSRLTAVMPSIAVAIAISLAPVASNAAESYQYNALSWLTQITYNDGSLCRYTYDNIGHVLSIVCTAPVTGVGDGPQPPLRFALEPITPNPSAGERTVMFSIPTAGHTQLRVFDLAGRVVATPFDSDLPAGRYSARIAAQAWSPGTYFVRLTFAGHSLRARMIVLR